MLENHRIHLLTHRTDRWICAIICIRIIIWVVCVVVVLLLVRRLFLRRRFFWSLRLRVHIHISHHFRKFLFSFRGTLGLSFFASLIQFGSVVSLELFSLLFHGSKEVVDTIASHA